MVRVTGPGGHRGSILCLGLTVEIKASVSGMSLVIPWVQGAQPIQQYRTCSTGFLQVSLKEAILREVKNPIAHAQLPWNEKVES